MKFFLNLIAAPYFLALLVLLIASGAISIDKAIVATGRMTAIIFSAVDKSTSDKPPFPDGGKQQ
ncbi:MAG TPA: hypothetical protein V6D10_01375 [Trichocoleus sp.]|jgi:hypothetical protein